MIIGNDTFDNYLIILFKHYMIFLIHSLLCVYLEQFSGTTIRINPLEFYFRSW